MEVFTKRVKFFPESQFFVLKLRWAFLRLGFVYLDSSGLCHGAVLLYRYHQTR